MEISLERVYLMFGLKSQERSKSKTKIDKLYEERKLLESEQTFILLLEGDFAYNDARDDFEKNVLFGSVTISNFKVQLHPVIQDFNQKKLKATDYFVLLLSDGTTLKTSKVIKAVNDTLEFNEVFEFSIKSDFNIVVKVFYSTLVESHIKRSNSTATCNFFYENTSRNRRDLKKNEDVLKTSFKLCGELKINEFNFKAGSYEIRLHKNPKIFKHVTCKTRIENLRVIKNHCGNLFYGEMVKGKIVWRLVKCVLYSFYFEMYDLNGEDETERPFKVINLIHSIGDCVKLEHVQSSTVTMVIDIINFRDEALEHYYFQSDNFLYLSSWVESVNLVLKALKMYKTMAELV